MQIIYDAVFAPWWNGEHVFVRNGEVCCSNWRTARTLDDVCICVGTIETSSRMNSMTLSLLLTKANAIMTEEVGAICCSFSTNGKLGWPTNHHNSITYYRCSGLNHFAEDCEYWCAAVHRKSTMLLMPQSQSHFIKMPEKLICPLASYERGTLYGWSIIDRVLHTAVVDSGCSQSLTNSLFQVDVLTADRKILWKQGVGSIKLCGQQWTHQSQCTDWWQEVIRVWSVPGYGCDQNIGRALVTELGKVHFCNAPICAGIRIKEPDISTEFNQNTKVWMSLWKWSDGNPPEKLQNQTLSISCLMSEVNTSVTCRSSWITSDLYLILRKILLPEKFSPTNGYSAKWQKEGIRLSRFKWAYWYIHNSYQHVCTETMCLYWKGQPTDTCTPITVAISNHNL